MLISVLIAILLLACPACGAAAAQASVFKCRGAAGAVVYQDAPCAAGTGLRDFDRDPANVSVIPFRTPAPASAHAPPRTDEPRTSAGARSARHPPGSKPAPAARAAPGREGDARQRRFLRNGMTESEVRARVGAPDHVTGRSRTGQRWTYLPAPDDPDTVTTVAFEAGRIADVERRVMR